MTMRSPAQPSGWAAFAGVILFIAGWLNFFYGLGGILNDEVVTVQGRGVVIWDFTAWGWIHLIIGVAMVLTSAGLFTGATWGRVGGVVFATVNAIAQIGLITAFPLFSILIIILDVLVIYHLTAGWESRPRDRAVAP
jgi:hypothetical protein